MKFIKWFEEVTLADIALVGGKNASLGQMITELQSQGIIVPLGFAVTADAYRYYIEHNKLLEPIRKKMDSVRYSQDINLLQETGAAIRALILAGQLPDDLAQEIVDSYAALSDRYKQHDLAVAVRSSATAEDLPTASFAGQQETYLNICGASALLESCKKGYASLFTDRAIAYRIDQGFAYEQVALSLGVQKMVRSDLAASGVAFSLDPETGFRHVVTINAAYGLGETVVQGQVVPDEFVVHKPTLEKGFASIIKKKCGEKQERMIFGQPTHPTLLVPVPADEQQKFSLTDDEVLALARMVDTIEQHYTTRKGSWSPMDVEWAKDGIDGNIYIVQARPETVHVNDVRDRLVRYQLLPEAEKEKAAHLLLTGRSVGQKITVGPVRLIDNAGQLDRVHKGDIVVTTMTDPDWVPIMKRAAGIITDRGGRTCHAAIVSRELGLPALVGVHGATKTLRDGQVITLDCSQGEVGYVYEGNLPYQVTEFSLTKLPSIKTKVMVNVADPDQSFSLSFLPVDGVGLARIEFIINKSIQVHPMVLLHPEKITDKHERARIDTLIGRYQNGADFFVDTLARGVAMIAAAFYPKPVIVRLSDFKSNEYRHLLGGTYFEPQEENPMLGLRGASRYYSALYQEAFTLELKALHVAREVMGMANIKIMVPFVRTTDEAERVIELLAQEGLQKGVDDLELVMMVEVPSNVILIDEFCTLFDGFSIGSNDLTQLTLGADRDSGLLAGIFDERNQAVMALMRMAIGGAHKHKKFIGICGQAPSDFPEVAKQLIAAGIDSLSLNPDAVLPFLMSFVQ